MATTFRGPQWVALHLTIGTIEALTCFGCLIYSIYVYKQRSYKSPLPKYFKLLNFFGILSFLLCTISHCINAYYYNTQYWTYSTIQTITWYLTWLFWSLAQFFSYLLFLNRINRTFDHSMYQISTKTNTYLRITLFGYISLWLFANFFPLIALLIINHSSLQRLLLFYIEFYTFICITIIDILITVPMTYIFVSKLHKMVFAQTSIRYTEVIDCRKYDAIDIDNNNKSFGLLTSKHLNIIKISSKITILSVCSLLSSSILILLRAVAYFNYKHINTYHLLDKIDAIWLQFDTMISCICLILFLPKTQRGYELFCCLCNICLSKYIKEYIEASTIQSCELTVTTNSNQDNEFANKK
eukprot:130538_1